MASTCGCWRSPRRRAPCRWRRRWRTRTCIVSRLTGPISRRRRPDDARPRAISSGPRRFPGARPPIQFPAHVGVLTYSGTVSLQLDEYHGVYNSAWVGSMMTLVSTAFISMAGFYMVKNTIQRDQQTRVGLVLATTPMSTSLYTLGKALSNFAVLAAMVSVLAVAAVILQLVRAEGGGLELGKLLVPFIWVALPAMARAII